VVGGRRLDASALRFRCEGHLESRGSAPHPPTALRKYFRKYLPDADAVRSHRLVAAFGGWLAHPNLWHLNRR